MQIFDSHCHYNLEPLVADWNNHWQQAQRAGVKQSIIVGTSVETSKQAIDIAQTSAQLHASVGIHPEFANQLVTNLLAKEICAKATAAIETLVTTYHPVAIGEIGLDYYRLKAKGQKREEIVALQKELCRTQMRIAKKYNLPIIFHVRDQSDRSGATAYADIISLIKEESITHFVLHCISGTQEYVHEALSLGAYISVAGNCTYATAGNLRELLTGIPPEKLMIETDAPFLAPEPQRSALCEPRMIRTTATFLAENLTVDLDLVYQTTQTFFRIQ